MSREIYLAGGDLSVFSPSDLVSVTESTAAGHFDPVYARSSIRVTANTSFFEGRMRDQLTGAPVNPTKVWFHHEIYQSANGGASGTIWSIFNSSGVEVFRLKAGAANTAAFRAAYRNSAGVLTDIGAGETVAPGTTTRFPIDVMFDCAGEIQIFINGNLQAAASGTFSSTQTDNIAVARFRCPYTAAGYVAFSQIVAANEPTVNWKVAGLFPTADGANTAATGTFADVDEATTVSDLDFISFAAAGDKESFVMSDVTVPSTHEIAAVILGARAKLGVSGPQTLKGLVRSTGVNYTSANDLEGYISGGFSGGFLAYVNNPATGLAWAPADLNACELGLEAAA